MEYNKEYNKFQKALADVLNVKDELAEGMYSIYRSYRKVGFTKKEALTILMKLMSINKIEQNV